MWKRFWKWLLNFLFVLVRPNCWMANHGVDLYWDGLLNEMLDNPKFEAVRFGGQYTVKLNGYEIWISNFPYAYGRPYTKNGPINFLPRRRTRYRLQRLHSEWLFSFPLVKSHD